MALNFRTPYDGEVVRVAVVNSSPPRTKQSFKEECDINTIMRRYAKTGVAPVGVGVARYGDFSEAPTFFDAQLIIRRAEVQFKALPAAAREKFSNDVGTFLAFIGDKNNYDEAKRLGLLKDEAKPLVVVKPPVEEKVVVEELDMKGAKK